MEPLTGIIKVIKFKSFGFIQGPEHIEYFFHRSDAAGFDALTAGTRVRFLPRDASKGPRAEKVEAL